MNFVQAFLILTGLMLYPSDNFWLSITGAVIFMASLDWRYGEKP